VESLRFSAGAASLARALADRLEPGTVRLSTAVRRVEVHADGVGVSGSDSDGADVRVEARHAVVALPPALAAHELVFSPKLPPELHRLAVATPVWMGETVKVVARYASAFWRGRGLSGAAISHVGPLREVHDMSGPGGDPPVLFGFAQGVVTEDDVRRQLVRLFGPEAGEPAALRLVDWSRERWTTPAGARRAQRHDLYGHPLYRRPVEGRVHFVSTETAPAFAGHIEGALLAADEVVQRILASTADG
ncbi:MAG TPA: FAD-dependent oxidoreductase, partial [Longimicrobiales bacterium]|nr:FAD-dependent oxidoreductase [Longimicrobiales bacterium]